MQTFHLFSMSTLLIGANVHQYHCALPRIPFMCSSLPPSREQENLGDCLDRWLSNGYTKTFVEAAPVFLKGQEKHALTEKNWNNIQVSRISSLF